MFTRKSFSTASPSTTSNVFELVAIEHINGQNNIQVGSEGTYRSCFSKGVNWPLEMVLGNGF